MERSKESAINKSEQIAASSGLAYLEATTRFVEEGDLSIARLLLDEAIRLSGGIAGLAFKERLMGLSAYIYRQEQIGDNDLLLLSERHYYAGTGADGELTVVDASTTYIVH